MTELETILRLRLIIARAGGMDGLRWWDDRSFTPEADFIADRIFPQRPRLALAQIALAAGRVRHWEAIEKQLDTVHLFDLGGELEYVLDAVQLDEAWIPPIAITSIDQLALALGEVLPDGVGNQSGRPAETGGLEVEIGGEIDFNLKPTVLQAGALALAYLAAKPDQPVFPYLRRKTRTP